MKPVPSPASSPVARYTRTAANEIYRQFHRLPNPGKISMAPIKPMATQRDLSLAYSPGVAVPVLAIAGLKAKDIMGYCLLQLMVTGVIISLVLSFA